MTNQRKIIIQSQFMNLIVSGSMEELNEFWNVHQSSIDIHFNNDAYLVEAYVIGSLDKFRWLLCHDANPNARNNLLMYYSIRNDEYTFAEILIKEGNANINSYLFSKAVEYGSSKIIELFILANHKPTIQDLYDAIDLRWYDVIKIFLNWGFFTNNDRLIKWVTITKYTDLLAHLCESKEIDFNEHFYGNHIFKSAIETSDYIALDILLNAGYSITEDDFYVAMSSAIIDGDLKLVQWLTNHGFKITEVYIFFAIDQMYSDIVCFLLKNETFNNEHINNFITHAEKTGSRSLSHMLTMFYT